MKKQLLKEENYKANVWKGGSTKELAIFPETSQYIDREFLWRLSMAAVEQDETNFTRLEDYNRVLMVMEGEVVLSYEGERVARLKELEQDRFDGAWKTHSYGKIKDLNLMVRKGSEGYLDLVQPAAEKQELTSTYETEQPLATHALYCREGYCLVGCGGEETMVQPGQLLILEFEAGEDVRYTVMGEGITVRAQIFYDYKEAGPEIIPPEKATFDDYKACLFIANTQFRGASHVFKRLKKRWYDEALSAAINKLERLYVTTIIFMLGVFAIMMLTMQDGDLTLMTLIGIQAWIFIDCLVISPLIYLAVLPKPVRKHIKDVDNLTPYEQRVREEQMGRNERTDKIMKKYKNSGKRPGEQ